MKSIKLALLASIAYIGLTAFVGSGSLEIGDAAPMQATKMKSTSGEMVSLEDVKASNGLLVMFTCNTCPFVVAWEDRYTSIQQQAKKNNIGVILVNSNEGKRDGDDSFDAMKKHGKEQGFTAPYVVDNDSKLANAFGAATTPHVYLFDKAMKLAYVGAIDDNYKSANDADKHYLKDAMNSLVAGKKINPNKTKALGCSIKRP
jgi:peroxiredoxin